MSNNIIDSIQLSGTVYTIQGTGGGGSPTVELTQAEYDALVSAGTVSANTYYIITDAQAGDLTQYWTSAQTQSAINQATSGKVDTSAITSSVTSASTDSEIPTAKAVYDATQSGGGGGGKAISAGTNISITTGETADTINCTLPITVQTQSQNYNNLLLYDNESNNVFEHNRTSKNIIFGSYNSIGSPYDASTNNIIIGNRNTINQGLGGVKPSFNFFVGDYNNIGKNYSENASHTAVFGTYLTPKNSYEYAFGKYNNSVTSSTTFGDSGNTLFSVGNGTSESARHNAFEIRQNGDIYLTSGGTDIKLQDHLGGGGSSINVVQTTGSSTTDVMSQDAVTTQLSGYVTTDTLQTISERKIFTYSSNSAKAIEFKQTSDSAKVGFRVTNSASTNNELASFEFRPNTYTDSSSVSHPLLYLGHYRNNGIAAAGVPQTMIGFRQYDQRGAAAYHYLMPLPAEAKTPFSLTTSFKNYFAPLGFKNGDTMITTDTTGVADFSSVLGGLKLVKLSQSDYNALTTKDDNTVYFIGDSTNGYTMKIGSANVN